MRPRRCRIRMTRQRPLEELRGRGGVAGADERGGRQSGTVGGSASLAVGEEDPSVGRCFVTEPLPSCYPSVTWRVHNGRLTTRCPSPSLSPLSPQGHWSFLVAYSESTKKAGGARSNKLGPWPSPERTQELANN